MQCNARSTYTKPEKNPNQLRFGLKMNVDTRLLWRYIYDDADSKRCASTCIANNSVATKRKKNSKNKARTLTMHLQQIHWVRFACTAHLTLAHSTLNSAIKVRHRVAIIVCSLCLYYWHSSHTVYRREIHAISWFLTIKWSPCLCLLIPHINQFIRSTSICCV